jgi:hypothetical protein
VEKVAVAEVGFSQDTTLQVAEKLDSAGSHHGFVSRARLQLGRKQFEN